MMEGIRAICNQFVSFIQDIPRIPGRIARSVADVFQSIGNAFSSTKSDSSKDIHVSKNHQPDGVHVSLKDGKIEGLTKEKTPSLAKAQTVDKSKNEELNGRGKRTLSDGTVEEGKFKDGKLIEGEKRTGRAIFKGQFDEEGNLTGQGEKTIRGASYAKGNFEDGRLEGKGEIFYNNGTYLKGNFEQHRLAGKGEAYNPFTDKTYKGDFTNNQMMGKCTVTDNQNKVTKVDYRHVKSLIEDDVNINEKISEDKLNAAQKLGAHLREKLVGNTEKKIVLEDLDWQEREGIKGGSRVRGEMNDKGELHGKGERLYPGSGASEVGQFKNNVLIEGKRSNDDGTIFQKGKFSETAGRLSGEGEDYYNKTSYKGNFEEGKKQGLFTVTDSEKNAVKQVNYKDDVEVPLQPINVKTNDGANAKAAAGKKSDDFEDLGEWRIGVGGDRSRGGVDDKGLLHGKGEIIFDDGEKQIGQFKNGLLHGQGERILPDGTVATGEYENGGLINGKRQVKNGSSFDGKFNPANGQLIEGTITDSEKNVKQVNNKNEEWQKVFGGKARGKLNENNRLEGEGEFVYSNGSMSEKGFFKDGELIRGESIVDNKKFVGEFNKNSNLQGRGLYSDGTQKYVGNFENGKKQGLFTVTNSQNIERKAKFENDVEVPLPAPTTRILEDGSKGEFVGDDLVKKTLMDGAIHEGAFDKNDQLIEGKIVLVGGVILQEGQFKEGELIKGKITVEDFSVAIGQFKGTKLEGQGEYHEHEGDKWVGNFENGKKQGLFTVTDSEKNVRQVNYKDDVEVPLETPSTTSKNKDEWQKVLGGQARGRMNASGRLDGDAEIVYSNGVMSEKGFFKDGELIRGESIVDNEKFVGEFNKNSKLQGKGEYSDGTHKYVGNFENGEKQGLFKVTDNKNNVREVNYKNNVEVSLERPKAQTTRTLEDGSKGEFVGDDLVKKTLKDGAIYEGTFDKSGNLIEGFKILNGGDVIETGTFNAEGRLINGDRTSYGIMQEVEDGSFKN